jgi:hypothetical protein
MPFPVVPKPEEVAKHFIKAMKKNTRLDKPYTRWLLENTLPEDLGVGIAMLPIVPPFIEDWGGVRDYTEENSHKRTFLSPKLQEDFPMVKALIEGFQRPDVARQFSETCRIAPERLEGGYLRIEYMQDTNGMWLKPHPDITAKLFSMVIYLCTGPEVKNWGTDIYDANQKWVDRGLADFNRATIFVRTDTTFHGFEKRPIIGVRRLLEVNYVIPEWRDRWQLCLPDRPATLKG